MLGDTEGCANTKLSSIVCDFQSKLEAAQSELTTERDKVVTLLKLLHLQLYLSTCRLQRKYKNSQQKPETSISDHSSHSRAAKDADSKLVA